MKVVVVSREGMHSVNLRVIEQYTMDIPVRQQTLDEQIGHFPVIGWIVDVGREPPSVFAKGPDVHVAPVAVGVMRKHNRPILKTNVANSDGKTGQVPMLLTSNIQQHLDRGVSAILPV
jgi:hypothetical protein